MLKSWVLVALLDALLEADHSVGKSVVGFVVAAAFAKGGNSVGPEVSVFYSITVRGITFQGTCIRPAQWWRLLL